MTYTAPPPDPKCVTFRDVFMAVYRNKWRGNKLGEQEGYCIRHTCFGVRNCLAAERRYNLSLAANSEWTVPPPPLGRTYFRALIVCLWSQRRTKIYTFRPLWWRYRGNLGRLSFCPKYWRELVSASVAGHRSCFSGTQTFSISRIWWPLLCPLPILLPLIQ